MLLVIKAKQPLDRHKNPDHSQRLALDHPKGPTLAGSRPRRGFLSLPILCINVLIF